MTGTGGADYPNLKVAVGAKSDENNNLSFKMH